MRRRLFVAGGAIDLAGEEQAADGAGLKTGAQLTRVEVVVLDRVARTQDVRTLQAAHGLHGSQLHIKGQGRGNAVGIELVRGQPFGLQEDLVRVLVGKAVHLVFNARAVARAHTFDDTGEHGAAVEAALDDLVRTLVGMGDPAGHLLRVLRGLAQKAEHRHGIQVTWLFFQPCEVDGPTVQTRWRARLQPPLCQLQLLEPRRKAHRGWVAGTPCAVVLQAHVDASIQKCSRRQDHGTRSEAYAHLRDSAYYTVALQHQVINCLLKEPKVGLVFQTAPNGRLVQNPIGLRPRGAHRWSLAAVENAKLNAAFVGGFGHRATQGVDLLDQVALANAPDARVAAHLPQRFDVVAEQERGAAHARAGQGGLGARVATANNDHIKDLRVQHGACDSTEPFSRALQPSMSL